MDIRTLPFLCSCASAYTVGVMALQGGVSEHMDALARAHVEAVKVRSVEDLARVDALILPGGESTTLRVLLDQTPLLDALRKLDKPTWGVCAGLIALADETLVGGLDVDIDRNAYGRQSATAFRLLDGDHGGAYFVRAPKITRVGSDVEILARLTPDTDSEAWERHENCKTPAEAVAVRQGHILGTAFHPEISSDDSWMRFFLQEICGVDVPPAVHHSPIDATVNAPWTPPRSGTGTMGAKRAFAVFQKGGVIMDVTTPEQARLAERAGAVSVMALERIPADIRAEGGVARSSDPHMITGIMDAISIPVMAKARIGHFYEAKMLQALDVDCIDESEVLTAADEAHHIDKTVVDVPFVCGAQDLGEALRRIVEGAAMIRLKGNAGTGNVAQAVRHARSVFSEIRRLQTMRDDELYTYSKNARVPLDLVKQTKAAGRLPVVTFAAGGLATPADVALLMELGCDGVFVGSGIFKGANPERRARAMVEACTHYTNTTYVAQISGGLGRGMPGLLEHEKGRGTGVDMAVAE